MDVPSIDATGAGWLSPIGDVWREGDPVIVKSDVRHDGLLLELPGSLPFTSGFLWGNLAAFSTTVPGGPVLAADSTCAGMGSRWNACDVGVNNRETIGVFVALGMSYCADPHPIMQRTEGELAAVRQTIAARSWPVCADFWSAAGCTPVTQTDWLAWG